MDTRSPTEFGRQKTAEPTLRPSDLSLLLSQNAETAQLVRSQSELINILVNKQTAMEEKINRQERSIFG